MMVDFSASGEFGMSVAPAEANSGAAKRASWFFSNARGS